MFVGCRMPIKSQELAYKTRLFSATVALLFYPYGHQYALALFNVPSFPQTVSAGSLFIRTTVPGGSTLNLVVEDLPFGLTDGLVKPMAVYR